MRRRRKHDEPLERVNLLEVAPVRVAAWQEKQERAIVERPRPTGRGLGLVSEWLAYWTAARQLRLDAVGTFAWRRLEGRVTVGEIAEQLRSEFGAEAEPVEERLGLFVRQLRREKLVAYPGWDDVPVAPSDGAAPR